MPQVVRFTLDRLRTHSASIRAEIAPTLCTHSAQFDEALKEFSQFLDDLEAQPVTLQRNVKLMLSCKLLNHVYSALILAENGLIVDLILCERNALETVAFHWLVCLDANALGEYDSGNIPRPVEVRRRLESLGVDISDIRDLYSSGSQVSHVSRESERFHSDLASALSGKLLFAGSHSPEDQREMFTFLPALLHLFQTPLVSNSP